MSVILTDMSIKVLMEGNVNGHSFTIEGDGEGKTYKGCQLRNLEATKSAPMPFAYVILTPAAFHYGNGVFTKYPSEIPDYFKQCFPDRMTWERSTIFEDGGVCTVNCNISLKLEENCFVHDIRFNGVHFLRDGPVMKKETQDWEPSTEKMHGRDEVPIGQCSDNGS